MQIEALTFVVLTYNEGQRLDRALASLPQHSRILVIDAYSSDNTLSIAERYHAQILQRAWTTFADARRFAITQVTTPWLFMLDADEALTGELRDALLNVDDSVAGYRCLRLNRFCGRVIQGGAWAHELVLRLVQTHLARIEAQAAGDLHEHLVVTGEVATIDAAIDHDSYPSLASYWQKFHRYTAIEAAAQRATFLNVLLSVPRACIRAIWQLTIRHGYRDGWRGFFIAYASAAYTISVTYRAWRASL